MNKQNFKLYQKVKFKNTGDNFIDSQGGIILGKSVVNVLDFYIVQLDNPTNEYAAIQMIESCLEAVD